MPDFENNPAPGLLLPLCEQGLPAGRGLAAAFLGDFANVDRGGLRLTLLYGS